jgi:muramoyltetrapeptide carboxypeptidase
MRIRIEAPSSPFSVDKLMAGVAKMRAFGLDVDASHALPVGERQHAYLAGDDDKRCASLQEALASDVDVVWLARGGYGLTRIVRRIQAPARGPTIIGFSDATALFGQLAGTGVRCVHGPLATTIADEPDDMVTHCLDVLARKSKGKRIEVRCAEPIDVEGAVFAGNLCVLAALVGTSALPSLDGAILVLEEVGERPYRIDRNLTQLKESGALAGVRAVVTGYLTRCVEAAPPSPQSTRDPAPTALEVFAERLGTLAIPLCHGLPLGHEPRNYALPLGARARLSGSGGTATLELLE